VSSVTAAWRATISDAGAGPFSQPASVSSPAGVAATDNNSKERRPAEQIQIVRVQVTVVLELISRLAGSSPTVLNACNATFVVGDGTLCRRARPEDAVMQLEKDTKEHGRRE
jgi:hypothetical protein